MINQLLIHNGNKKVKPWFANKHELGELPNIADSWTFENAKLKNLHDKILYSNARHSLTDLTVADKITITDLVELKKHFKFVKVVSDYKTDLGNLDDSWNNYSYQQWIESIFYGLSFTDQLVWWDELSFPYQETEDPLVFTPGRSGTHLLIDIVMLTQKKLSNIETSYFLHHSNHLLHRIEFQKLVNSKKIYSVLRNSLLKQTLSSTVANHTGTVVLTTKDTNKQIKELVSLWGKFTFKESDCLDTLTSIVNYTDILLGLKYFYQKNISFSVFEELSHHYDSTTKYIKNPIEYEHLFENYEYAVECCNKYQSFYQSVIDKVSNTVGISLHNHESI